MRVAHILRKYDPSQWGGTETAIERLALGFAGQNVDSIVFAPRILPAVAGPDPLASAGCAVRRFWAVVPTWGISAERKREMIAVGGNMISFDLIRSLWREPELDVIHSHALGRLGAIGRVIARERQLPFVVSVHGGAYDLPPAVRHAIGGPAFGGLDWGKPLGLLLGARHLFNDADAIIALNQREASLIRERHPGCRVIVQPHGVPAALFAQNHRPAARSAFPALANRSILLVLGRIDPVKNQDWLVAQAGALVRRHPQAVLVFVGACTNQAYLEAIRTRLAAEGLQNSVVLAGPLPPGDPRLIGLLQEAKAVVLPSMSETFGIVILEAWAAGTPVVSSRTSGASMLVEDGVNGLLFDLGQPDSFHTAVDRLLGEEQQRQQWGASGLAKVVADYDTVVLARRMKGIYEDLIEEKNDAHRHPARR